MDTKEKIRDTEDVMICINCGHPVFQSEIDKKKGKCPNCNEKFQPFYNSE